MKSGTITSGMSGTITSGISGTISPEWVALYHRNEWHNYLRNMQRIDQVIQYWNDVEKWNKPSYIVENQTAIDGKMLFRNFILFYDLSFSF